MTRRITADEVRRFFQSANRQFEEAGFFIHCVRFTRTPTDPDSDTETQAENTSVTLNYTERRNDIPTDTADPTQSR